VVGAVQVVLLMALAIRARANVRARVSNCSDCQHQILRFCTFLGTSNFIPCQHSIKYSVFCLFVRPDTF
jgi:hypothetical protein